MKPRARKIRRLALLAAWLGATAGCGALRMELPDEFKARKLKEDPPISRFTPQPRPGASQGA